ncbi:MAG: acylphosphatase [Chloroflexi bacterium]|nr:acylphosphatase [Chloroflexota bacterium]
MSDLVHLHAVIHGRVQGVYYRAFTARVAKSLSLKGYVKNMARSGDVEVDAEGERAKLEEILDQLKAGPPDAMVETIDTRWSEYTGQYTNFDVRY